MSTGNYESDLDYYKARLGPDLTEVADRAAEQDREQRWNDFCCWAKDADVPTLLLHVVRLMNGQRDPYYGRIDDEFLSFVDTEQWSGVLSAIARVQRQKEDRHEQA